MWAYMTFYSQLKCASNVCRLEIHFPANHRKGRRRWNRMRQNVIAFNLNELFTCCFAIYIKPNIYRNDAASLAIILGPNWTLLKIICEYDHIKGLLIVITTNFPSRIRNIRLSQLSLKTGKMFPAIYQSVSDIWSEVILHRINRGHTHSTPSSN